jgi:GNAT superfamily N-acetyltransferase
MAVQIRPAQVADTPGMARVMVDTWLEAHRGQVPEGQWERRRAEWTYDVSERSWREFVEGLDSEENAQECLYVAATEDGEVVGLAVGCPAAMQLLENAAEVSALYVRSTWQGQGIGRGLVQAVAAHQARLGRSALLISVLETNAPARRFYEAIGGRLAGTHETEDYGFKEPQVVYGWEDIGVLRAKGEQDTQTR